MNTFFKLCMSKIAKINQKKRGQKYMDVGHTP